MSKEEEEKEGGEEESSEVKGFSLSHHPEPSSSSRSMNVLLPKQNIFRTRRVLLAKVRLQLGSCWQARLRRAFIARK